MLRHLVLGTDRVVSRISHVAAGIAALATLGCFGLVCYVVVARYFFGLSPSWSDEVGGWLVVALVMLAVAEGQRRGEHIGVDLLLERTEGGPHRALKAFGALCVAVAAGLLLWQGLETMAFSRMIGARALAVAEVPLWMVQALIPLGAGLMLLVALVQLLGLATGVDLVPEPKDVPRATE